MGSVDLLPTGIATGTVRDVAEAEISARETGPRGRACAARLDESSEPSVQGEWHTSTAWRRRIAERYGWNFVLQPYRRPGSAVWEFRWVVRRLRTVECRPAGADAPASGPP